MNNNETNGISIQDLEQWFNEELELYERKIQEQSQAKLNSKRINNVIQVLIEYGLAEDCSGSALIEVGGKCLDDIVQELNKALE